MAWTAPATWSVSEIVTASKMNTHVRDNFAYLKGQAGTVAIEDTISLGPATAGPTSGLLIGGNGSGNRTSYLDLVGDGTNAYGMRFIRYNTGVNANTDILHRGTGGMGFQAQDASGYIYFTTGGGEAVRIDGNKNVGIGTASPQGRLQVNNAVGGAAFVGASGVGGTASTLLIAGTVTAVANMYFTIRDSNGTCTSSITVAVVLGATHNMVADGTNTYQFQVSAGGAVTVQRTAGSRTFSIVGWVQWI